MKALATLSLLVLLSFIANFAGAQDPPKAEPAKTDPPKAEEKIPNLTKEELEKKFQETMDGATLVGRFTSRRGDKAEAGGEEKYGIKSVKKLYGDVWLFTAQIKYGNHDAEVPLPLRVLWAGDTPVITLDKFPVPGFGTFSARVLIYDNKYAGTWDGGNHGGVLSGRVTKEAAAEKPAETKGEKSVDKK
jgi:hypothetical protein